MLKVIDLFSGIGSQTQALKNLGYGHEVIGISEIDKYAITSYEAIHGKTNNLGDISKIEELPQCDLLTYSFPCQDLSLAGKQAGIRKGTRSGLLYEVERLLDISKERGKLPRYLLLENVKNLAGPSHKKEFDRWLSKLEQMGYRNHWTVLNSKDYNVPHNRARLFVVSTLCRKRYVFPKYAEREISLLDIIEIEIDQRYKLPAHAIDKMFANIAPDKLDLVLSQEYSVIDYRYDEGVRVRKDFISPCLTTKSGTSSLSGQPFIAHTVRDKKTTTLWPSELIELRKLTPLECWRIMGQSDEAFYKAKKALNEKFYGGKDLSDSQLYKQAGNSIVVPVLEEIFRDLFDTSEIL